MTTYDKVNEWYRRIFSEGYEGHDSILFPSMNLESASLDPTPENPHNAKTVFTIVVDGKLCNMAGSLHGGAVALIFDVCTSTAISAVKKPGFWEHHVSRNLNVTFLRPVAEGQKIWVESEVVHLGKRMGMTRGLIRNEEGKVCYTCEHGKAALEAPRM